MAEDRERIVHDDFEYVQVYCKKCGKSVGYVAPEGHKEWLCDKHSGQNKVVAVKDAAKHTALV